VRYLSLAEVLLLHRLVMEQSGQQAVLRDLGSLQAAVAQPRQTFGGQDLYRDVAGKVAALGFSLIQNHPFVDGNKRVGHAAMVAFLRLNGRRLEATLDEAERAILQVASGVLDRAGLQAWIDAHDVPA
jgi:death-on-curing protein